MTSVLFLCCLLHHQLNIDNTTSLHGHTTPSSRAGTVPATNSAGVVRLYTGHPKASSGTARLREKSTSETLVLKS